METVCVGISHTQDNTALMNNECRERFRELVTPRIGEGTVLLIEGFSENGPVCPGTPEYKNYIGKEFPGILGDKEPNLVFKDPRNPGSPKQIARVMKKLREWLTFVNENFTFSGIPENPRDVEAAIREGRITSEFTGKLGMKTRELARFANRMNRSFNQAHEREINLLSRRYKQCFFVGGVAHAFELSMKMDLECLDLSTMGSSLVRAEDMAIGYFALHRCPEIALKKGS